MDMAKWIDHLSFQHNITFVKAQETEATTLI